MIFIPCAKNLGHMQRILPLSGLFFILFNTAYAQLAEMPFNDESKICYDGIVDIPEKDKAHLYKEAKEYVLLNYTNNGYPVLLDEENERIYVKGAFEVPFRKYYFPFFINTKEYNEVYTMKLFFKDNKIRYEITDISIQRKLKAKVKGVYWGYGVSTSTISEAEVLKYDLEQLYIDRYRKPFYKLFQYSAKGIKGEIEKMSTFMAREYIIKDW